MRRYGKAPILLVLILLALVTLPFFGIVLSAAKMAASSAAWIALYTDPQWPHALALTLVTSVGSTLLACWLVTVILATTFTGPSWERMTRLLPGFLALPHVAFAVGLVFLVSPSGWLLRALSPSLTGFDHPPLWTTTQDPYGLGLIAVLVLKELPFLLWAAATQLQRPEVGPQLRQQWQLAQTLGHSPKDAWWRVIAPQLWRRLYWPVLAVLAYGMSVVDVALIIGPTAPPTAAVLAYTWLGDADNATNQQGAALAWLGLALWVGWVVLGYWVVRRLLTPWVKRWCATGIGRTKALPTPAKKPNSIYFGPSLGWPLRTLIALYLGVLAVLMVSSFAGFWPFPDLWPTSITTQAWSSVLTSSQTLLSTISLACASAALSLVVSVCWLEWGANRVPSWMSQWMYLPLILPPVLWVIGFYQASLEMGIAGTWLGVALGHLVLGLPCTMIALSPAYRDFDPRYAAVAASMGGTYGRFLWRVKWPMLKAALASAFALGFAVSVAQFLPTQFIGAGRLSTVTTEAVTLAAGAQRDLAAAYAGLQCLLPLLAFGLAHWLGRPRRFKQRLSPHNRLA